jgi:hypothetical protein
MNIFLITSVIKVSDNHLEKSFCHHPRRQHETLKTIYSIREKNPDAKIFLLECSHMSKEQENFLREKVDIFLNLSDTEIHEAVLNSKSTGEKMMTLKAIDYLEKENINFDNLFKISGRYWLNENFNLDNYKNESYTIKRLENNIVLSNFYKLPKRLVSKFKEYLNSISEEAEFRISFTNFIDGLKDEEENKKEIKGMIGISGFKSSNGDFLYM